MGMAASQGRLLFMTARLSNNEFEQQCVAYSKQRLADSSQRINDEYLAALNSTQYQILTGYNGNEATYEAVTYNVLTGYFGNSQVTTGSGITANQTTGVAANKQYVVKDNKGQVLVTQKVAEAFHNSKGDFNKFLEEIGGLTQVKDDDVSQQAVHEAWDKYLVSIGKGANASDSVTEHILGFAYNNEAARIKDASGNPTGAIGEDVEFATYKTGWVNSFAGEKIYVNLDTDHDDNVDKYYAKNYAVLGVEEDTSTTPSTYKVKYQTEAQKDTDEYSYIEGLTSEPSEKYIEVLTGDLTDEYRTEDVTPSAMTETVIFYEGTTKEQRELYDYAMAVSKQFATDPSDRLTYDPGLVNYYQNIFNEMTTGGFTTYKEMLDTKYMACNESDEKVAYQDDQWLITQLKHGKLNISYYSALEKEFIQTTLDDDESICEKEDKKKIALAEQVYNTRMNRLQAEDKQFDLTLNRLEAEHSALQTEYEAVAKVISKNVEKSFNIFNA